MSKGTGTSPSAQVSGPATTNRAPLDVHEATEATKSFDKMAKEGSICDETIHHLLEDVDVQHSRDDVGALFRFLDADGSGRIELDEFLTLVEIAKSQNDGLGEALKDLHEERREAGRARHVRRAEPGHSEETKSVLG